MADFFDDEAEVGTTDEEDEVEDNSKLKKKPKRAISSDEDEEDDDDEEKAREEMRGFIAVSILLQNLVKSHCLSSPRCFHEIFVALISRQILHVAISQVFFDSENRLEF